MDPAQLGVMIPIIALMIPIVAIWTKHQQKIAEMQAMRDTLAHLAERCQGNDRPNCPILADLEGRPLRQKTAAETTGGDCCGD